MNNSFINTLLNYFQHENGVKIDDASLLVYCFEISFPCFINWRVKFIDDKDWFVYVAKFVRKVLLGIFLLFYKLDNACTPST